MSDATQSSRDLNLVADSENRGQGDIVFKAGSGASAVELARISRAGALNGALTDPRAVRGNGVWALGDSIVAGAGVYPAPFQLAPNQFLGWLGPLTNQRLNPQGFAGAPGQTAATILSVNLPLVLAASPKPAVCFVLAGTNDASQAVPLASTIAALTSIAQTLAAAGILPVMCTLPPRTVASGFQTATGLINAWVTRFAALNGYPLADVFGAVVDPATGAWLAAYDSGDGVHASNAGAVQIATVLATALASIAPPWAPALATFNADALGQLNSLFQTDTNADGVPDRWTLALNGTPTVGLAVDGAILGNAWSIQRGTVDLGGTSDGIAASAGDRVQLACKAKGINLTSTGGTVDIWMKTYQGASLFRPMTAFNRDFGWQTIACEAVCPAGTTGFQVIVQIQGFATAKLQLAQFTLRNLTALGLA